ncbi:lectin like domain-containing protein [Planctomycetota bacterium]
MRKLIILAVTIGAIGPVLARGQAPPANYDLRDYDRVTPVKKQLSGTCWAHATLAAIESNLLTTGAWTGAGESGQPNLAEYHLDWWNGFNQFNNNDHIPYWGNGLEVHYGGDYRVSTAYMARGEGVIFSPKANTDNYYDETWFDNLPEKYDPNYHFYYARDVEWLVAEPNLSNIAAIKNKIMSEGGVATCYCSYDGFIWETNIHYQPPSDPNLPNHAVVIVGWDNSKITQAPAPGAWLIKNSWGDEGPYAGDQGYYWISYYDKWCCQHPEMGAVCYRNVEPLAYDLVYYHDYHGWRDTKTDITEAFNAFTGGGNQLLKAVSFYTADDDVSFTLKIYDRFEGGDLLDELTSQSGTIENTGFHTIELNSPVELTRLDDFYVYVYLSHGGHAFDRTSQIPILLGEEDEELPVVESSAQPGESYYYNGSSWEDLYDFDFDDPVWGTWDHTANFCIKALVVKSLFIELTKGPTEPAVPGSAPEVQIKITPGSENYAAGTATVWYRYDDGAFASISMTADGGDLYSTTLPTVGWGDKPEYYFNAQGDQGGVGSLPDKDPSGVFSLVIGEKRIIFADNFEEDKGWEPNNLGAVSGDWQRGVPVNDPAWQRAPASDSDGSGQCYLTQNEMGNTDVDAGPDGDAVSLISPTIDMSFGQITIAYDYFFYQNNRFEVTDHLRVEINSNDGIGPWIEIADHIHIILEDLNWHHYEIGADTLSALGVNPSATTRLRFTVNDSSMPSVVEAALDALSISSTRTTRPGDMDGDNDVDLVDFAIFTSYWQKIGCGLCGGADLFGEDGNVGLRDLHKFKLNWLAGKYQTTRPGDMDGDNDVDLVDFAIFTSYWQKIGCGLCGGADLFGEDGNVGLRDLHEFYLNWLAGK